MPGILFQKLWLRKTFEGKSRTVFEAEPVCDQNWAEEEFYSKYIYSFEAVLLLLVLFSLSILIVPVGLLEQLEFKPEKIIGI